MFSESARGRDHGMIESWIVCRDERVARACYRVALRPAVSPPLFPNRSPTVRRTAGGRR
ncbi:aldolase [Burkholderia pseudomallei]|nr:aldolase [Burkholderia pseudomallei]